MNIIGIGIDATDIPRVANVFARYGDRFLQRIFTDDEIAYVRGVETRSHTWRGRFAAKEAAMKALGTGRSRGVLWRDIEVIRGGGPPRLLLHGGAARRASSLAVVRSLITITHSESLAFAQVMLFGD